MLVAVIGGTRYVGRDITKLLVEAGHQVIVYNRGLYVISKNGTKLMI